jgi:hypothetical protein
MGRAETHKALPLPELYTTRGKRKWEVRILLFDRGPSFRPDLRQPQPARAAAVKDGPPSGHRLRRRAASLTAVSTTAASCAGGNRSKPIRPSKSAHAPPSKTEITLTSPPSRAHAPGSVRAICLPRQRWVRWLSGRRPPVGRGSTRYPTPNLPPPTKAVPEKAESGIPTRWRI